jgi:hypothetical protein
LAKRPATTCELEVIALCSFSSEKSPPKRVLREDKPSQSYALRAEPLALAGARSQWMEEEQTRGGIQSGRQHLLRASIASNKQASSAFDQRYLGLDRDVI